MWMVTGGNGRLGRGIVEALVRLVPPEEVVVGVRDPEASFGLRELGVQVRPADFEDAQAMATAFAGVDRLLLVSTNGMPHETRYQHHVNAASAAVRSGVAAIVYTSLIATAPDVIGRVHRQTEELLQGLGVRTTVLRHPFYLDSFLDDLVGESSLEAMYDGPVNAAWRSDLAEAAARVLADDGRRECYDFTGPSTFTSSELAAEIAEVSGRPMPFTTISEVDFDRQLALEGVPQFLRGILRDIQHAIAAGAFAEVNGQLGEVLGRAPYGMRERVRLLWGAPAEAG